MPERVMFVASTGGHLEELQRLRRSLADPSVHVTWVTFDTPQSRSVLAAEPDVHYVRAVRPRAFFALVLSLVPALRLLLRVRPNVVYSTGAAVALAYLPFAFLVGGRAVYIESATRTDGPSVTGRMISMVPWVKLRTQYRSWARGRWVFGGSVFDQWQPVPISAPVLPIKRLLVTLGTQHDFPFVSLVQRLQAITPPDVEVMWQLGGGFPATERPEGARDVMPSDELQEWVRTADVVVAHAGVGSALTMLGSGRVPVLVPRSATRGEHVDEHQTQLAQELAGRGLAVTVSPAELTWDDLIESRSSGVELVPMHTDTDTDSDTDGEAVGTTSAASPAAA